MKRRELTFFAAFGIYHLLFAIVAWQYNLTNPSDAYNYWHLNENWTSYFNVGTDVIKLINYPFSKILGLPFWSGFILYSMIGYYAIFELYKFAQKYINPVNIIIKYLLIGFFLLPNLHFWTSVIGKEPVVFLAITWIIIQQSREKYFSCKNISGWVLLILIRPHVALFMLLAIVITYIIKDKKMNLRKSLVIVVCGLLCVCLYVLTLQLLNRNPLDIAYILERNNASLIAFQRAGSYVPMIDYNMAERLFALNFRPLFFDSHSVYGLILSIENLLTILLFIYILFLLIKSYRFLKLDSFARVSILFFVISSLFFIQRYSCLGIFVRTKVMYMPFVVIVAIQLINSGIKKCAK